MKQDYIEGYLVGLNSILNQQVLTNGYELSLRLPEIVNIELQKLNLTKGKNVSHEVQDYDVYSEGYQEGTRFKSKNQLI